MRRGQGDAITLSEPATTVNQPPWVLVTELLQTLQFSETHLNVECGTNPQSTPK